MKTRNYTPEIKERAVRMLIEAANDYPCIWSAIQAIAPKIGCTPETVNGLYKSEVIHYLKQNWTGVNDVGLVPLEWVDWFNKTRLHSTIGYVPPFEFEKRYYDNLNLLGIAA